MHVLLMGPPGSGRRTQTLCLAGCLGLTPITWTDLNAEALGHRALERAVVTGGFVLSGYPRTIAEAHALDGMLRDHGVALDAVIALNVSPNLRLYRLAREDSDRRSELSERQSTYTTRTVPVLRYYRDRGLLDAVDGVGSVADVTLRLAACLHARRYEHMYLSAVGG